MVYTAVTVHQKVNWVNCRKKVTCAELEILIISFLFNYTFGLYIYIQTEKCNVALILSTVTSKSEDWISFERKFYN